MEQEYVFNLKTAGDEIRQWTRSYFRSNSKHKAEIKLRVCFSAPEQIFWKYYLELHIDGKMKYQTRITEEAYDTLNRDPKLPRSHYTGIDFTTLKSNEK